MGEGNFRIRIKKGQMELEIEGDKQFVDSRFKQIWSELLQNSRGEEKRVITEKRGELGSLEGLSLGEFYKMKSPDTYPNSMLVFFYWLKHKEAKEEINLKEIKSCYGVVSMPVDSNLSQTARALSSGKKAFLMKGSKRGYYKLTMSGENYVESLPKASE